jgi:N-acetylglucosamine kinase-like BadF-type ATPase
MIAGWAGSLGTADGINVVAGTGSMTYGERGGRGLRVGGWGELFGDEGSAHWMGVAALNAFSRMSDGRLPRSSLHDRIRAATGVEHDLDVIDVVLTRWGAGRGRIAGLARTVTTAAGEGDPTAKAIVEQAVQHLADLADTTRRGLGFEAGEPVPVSYSGGVFRADAVRSGFAAALEDRSPAFRMQQPRFPPAVGAALYAAKLAGAPLGTAALDRLAAATGAPTPAAAG